MKTPQYRRYRGKYARVCIDGRIIHLGEYGSEESKAKYKQLIMEWSSGHRVQAPATDDGPTVAEVLDAYRVWAESHYGEDPNGRYRHMLPTMRIVRELFADLPACHFGPKKLKTAREAFVQAGYSRGHVNACVQRVVGIFRWAASEEMVSGSRVHDLEAVEPLRRGHTKAPEGRAVKPVPEDDVNATLPELVPVLADMVRLQLLAGCRPGELISMTPGQVDRSDDIWIYRPDQHKNTHREHDRVIALGPKAQDILRPYLLRAADAPCFSPKEALAQFYDRQAEQRKTPLSCGTKPSEKKREQAIERVSDRYTAASYRRAVERACKRAGVAVWTPNRLRHTRASVVREQYGLDGAQVILGHTHARVTEIYSEINAQKAAEIARKLG